MSPFETFVLGGRIAALSLSVVLFLALTVLSSIGVLGAFLLRHPSAEESIELRSRALIAASSTLLTSGFLANFAWHLLFLGCSMGSWSMFARLWVLFLEATFFLPFAALAASSFVAFFYFLGEKMWPFRLGCLVSWFLGVPITFGNLGKYRIFPC